MVIVELEENSFNGAEMVRVYFDVHIFDDLFLSDGRYFRNLPRLHQLVSANRIRVFGSAKQLEELFGLADKNASAYRQVSKSALSLVGKHILRSRWELCTLELKRRKSLRLSDACVSPHELDGIRRLCVDRHPRKRVRKEVESQHQRFQETFAQLSTSVMNRLSLRGIHRKDLQKDRGTDWTVSKAQVDDWILATKLLRDQFAISSKKEFSTWQLPVLRSWFAFAIAHAYETIIAGLKIRPADKGDWEHYAYAAFGGLFVSNDRKLRQIASHIELRHVRVVSGDEFFQNLEQASRGNRRNAKRAATKKAKNRHHSGHSSRKRHK